jgi:hypothetical protein
VHCACGQLQSISRVSAPHWYTDPDVQVPGPPDPPPPLRVQLVDLDAGSTMPVDV